MRHPVIERSSPTGNTRAEPGMPTAGDTTRMRPILRTLLAIVAFSAVSEAVSAQTPPPAATVLTLEAAFTRATEANPTLAAARLRRSVDLAGRDVARERLNPEVRVEAERETPKWSYTFAQPLELGGKRGRRIDASEAAIHTGEAELAVLVLEVRAEVRRAYFDRVAADARLVLENELRDIASRVRDAAQQRFDAGSSPRLPINTCTCTPSDTHAISDTSASPRANTVATATPDPNDQRRRAARASAFLIPSPRPAERGSGRGGSPLVPSPRSAGRGLG